MKMLTRLSLALFSPALLTLTAQAQEIGLVTTYAAGNGQNGNMFDVRAETDLVVSRVDIHVASGSVEVEVYSTPNGYAGKTTSLSAWTLLGTATVTALGSGVPTPVPIQLNTPISAGQTMGFYVTSSNGSTLSYTNGSVEGADYVTDGNATILEGIGLAYPVAGSFSPRIWNGTLWYSLGGTAQQEGYNELYQIGGPSTDANSGKGATTIGDRNSDGIEDFVIGSPGDKSGQGTLTIRSGANGAQLQTISGLISSRSFGATVLNAGDTDGDGTFDLLVGAPGYQPGQFGNAYLFRNGATFPSAFFTGTADSEFGAALANLGDVNGDARPDFAIGAPRFDSLTSTDGGRFRIYSGATAGLLFSYESPLSNERLGSAITGLGDVDGDTVPDYAVGAPGASFDPFASDHLGRVEVWSGATNTLLYEVFGEEADADFGAALASLGDVTGDGIEDFIVGAPQRNAGMGAAYAFSGVDGSQLYSVMGTEPDALLGTTVGLLGDTDGDGHDDLALGAPALNGAWGYVELRHADSGTLMARLVQGYLSTGFGTATVGLGDINADGLYDFLITAPDEYDAGKPHTGVTRIVTTFAKPVVTSTQGVHSLDSGELVITGANLVGTTILVDGVPTAYTQVSPVELRIPVTAQQPGGFHSLHIENSEGSLDLPLGLSRYPALYLDPTPTLGTPVDLILDNGDVGFYLAWYSGKTFANPAPFEDFGWYYGLELNGVWTLTAGAFTAGDTYKTVTLPGPTSAALINLPIYVQAFTTQDTQARAGFTATRLVTLQAP